MRLSRDAAARKVTEDGKLLKAELLLADGTTLPYTGSLDAVERAVDPTTGTLTLQISFPNPDRLLRPGQYGRVRFQSESKQGALLVPQRAVQELQDHYNVAVVDPGVGSERPPVMVKADGRWFVGPGNGLFEIVMRRAQSAEAWEIAWEPEHLSASFHGRDLFAPVAAMIAKFPAARRRAEDFLDDDGTGQADVPIRVTVERRGRKLDFDFRAYATEHFERLRRTADSREFRAALS